MIATRESRRPDQEWWRNRSPSGSFRFAGLSRQGWLIVAVFLLHGGLLWALRDLPLYHPPAARPAPLVANFFVETVQAPSPVDGGTPAAEKRFTVTTQLVRTDAAPAKADPFPLPAAPPPAAPVIAADDPTQAPAAGQGHQASVFDITIPSYRMVYLVDVSGSMMDRLDPKNAKDARTRYETATDEVRRSIRLLPPDVSFNVVLFGSHSVSMEPAPVAATPEAKRRAEAFLSRLPDVGGGTDFIGGVAESLKMGPDSIFLLTDGGANMPSWKVIDAVRDLEERAPAAARLYAFGMSPRLEDDDSRLLQKLCYLSGGSYHPMGAWKKATATQ